jgi:hypothetical protein
VGGSKEAAHGFFIFLRPWAEDIHHGLFYGVVKKFIAAG